MEFLNQDEEETLEDFLLTASSIGFGKTRAHVMMYAEKVAREKNYLRKDHITGRWFDGFCERHPNITLRKGDSMAAVRFREHNFSGEPWRIYNVDETGMPLDPRKPRVITKLGTKKVRVMGSGNKHQITVVACASATGHIVPPLFNKWFDHFLRHAPPGRPLLLFTTTLISRYSAPGCRGVWTTQALLESRVP